uniref:MIF4G domain-containing protein n=1 Tax=viral metagenome TaxID=1070528 RepID=A0A6C0K578_9ZZZZ
MASMMSPMVTSILALRSELRPASDELKKRVQSIRVRSTQETQSVPGWRQKAHMPSGSSNHGSQGQLHQQGRWRNSGSSNSLHSPGSPGNASPTPGSPFRFSNTSPANIPTTPTPSTPVPSTPTPSGPPMRYVSRFHNGDKKGDDQILNTIILNKLNVFSVKTYDDVKQFLFQILGSDQREFVREFTWLVFRKAAAEDKFCPLFAKLLSDIKKEYPVILEEMQNLHTTYLDIWKNQDSDTKVDRRCRLGYSQFLAELTVLGVLESDAMKATIQILRDCIIECLPNQGSQATVEEYTDCLKQLCMGKIPKPIQQIIRDLLIADLDIWISKDVKEVPGLSSKSRFAFMDLRDFLVKSA